MVVKLPDNRLGVVDESNCKVWIERDLVSVRVPYLNVLPTVSLPSIPSNYGQWKSCSIGGVSKTIRRINTIRANHKHNGPIIVFATKAPSVTAISQMFEGNTTCTTGDPQHIDEYGIVTEIIVHEAANLAHVCALISKANAQVTLEDVDTDARRSLGIERLDRIGADIVSTDNMIKEDDGIYGLRRGNENWTFNFLPDDWSVPLTWDHMVQNVIAQDIEDIPQPLRQHVAKYRLQQNDFLPIGSKWKAVDYVFVNKYVNESPDEDLVSLVLGKRPLREEETIPLDYHVKINNVVFRPVDTSRFLSKHIPEKRFVSAALKNDQSKQLIAAFYFTNVDRQQNAEVKRAFSLIMFHYLKERGYMARWVGKYDQFANHVGNGGGFREFKKLSNYDPHRLPPHVLNRLLGLDGKLQSKGNKGTRSKYHKGNVARYRPKRRLIRTTTHETRMKMPE